MTPEGPEAMNKALRPAGEDADMREDPSSATWSSESMWDRSPRSPIGQPPTP